jgi:HK97 family phage portal protein
MALLDRLRLRFKWRGQPAIAEQEGDRVPSEERRIVFERAYKKIEVINRGTNLILDSAAEVDVSIGDRVPAITPRTVNTNGDRPQLVRKKNLERIINFQPNPFENVNEFRRQLYMDYILTGNIFQYFDGNDLYHLPSKLVEVKTGKQDKITGYLYDAKTNFTTNEIIHTRENSSTSVYVGQSRLLSANDSIRVLDKMLLFQETFFDNGAVPGLILTTPNVLGNKLKERLLLDIMRRWNAVKGGKRPIIFDADIKPNNLSYQTFRELDFSNSVTFHESKILKSLGVPPLLLDSGNNANINPNMRMFYENTVLPITKNLIASYECFFGYDLEPDIFKIRALRPDLSEAGNFFSSMVNNGIMTVNEARKELRLEESTDPKADELREPRNITGSATDPSVGGRPEEGESEENE